MERLAYQSDIDVVEAVPIDLRIKPRNTYELFAASAARDPKGIAISWLPHGRASDEAVTITYEKLFSRITKAANMLHNCGVRDGACVSLLMPNLPEMHYCLWGGSAAGIVNPVNPLLTPTQIVEIITAAGSRVLVVGGRNAAYEVYEKARAVRSLCRAIDTVIVVGDHGWNGEEVDFHAAVGREPEDHLVSGRVIQPDENSAYFHTGGTTGSPKLAQHTHRNQVFSAWSCAFALGLTATDVVLTGLPLFHANAAIGTGLSSFFAGSTVLLCGQEGYRSKPMMADFWRIVSRWRATIISGVPTIYAALLRAFPSDVDVSSLRYALSAAAPLPVSLFREFERCAGVRILEAYGMTEGGGAGSTVNPRDGERRVGSIGWRMPYQGVRIARLDPSGGFVRDCRDGETGLILLSGPNVFPGYKQDGFNQNIFPIPGWLNSGDLGRRDADGFFWIAGREKDLIIRGGHNIDPAVIEEALQQHPYVELAAAIGKPDAYAGEVPIAYVKLIPDAVVTSDELKAFALQRVPERQAAPTEVVILSAMPTTAVGKVFKPTLRQDAISRAIAAAMQGCPGVTVDVRLDDKRGIVVEVICPSADLEAEVERNLSNLPINYTVVGRRTSECY